MIAEAQKGLRDMIEALTADGRAVEINGVKFGPKPEAEDAP